MDNNIQQAPDFWRDDLDNRPIMVTIQCMTYNHQDYIKDALEGFIKQKTNFRFEAIVHDDASSDKTAEIIKEYAEKYPSIIKPILDKENQYRKGTLQKVMDAHTRGKYIAICEGDDYWIDPLKLQKQFDFLEENPEFIYVWTNARPLKDGKLLNPFKRYNKNCITPICDIIIKDGSWIPTASIFYRKFLADKIAQMKNKFPIGDYPLQIYGASIGSVYYINEVSCVYRVLAQGSWSSRHFFDVKKKDNFYSASIEMLKYLDNYLDNQYSDIFAERINIVNMLKCINSGDIVNARKYWKNTSKKYRSYKIGILMEIFGLQKIKRFIKFLLNHKLI